jgi:hypothetical protein
MCVPLASTFRAGTNVRNQNNARYGRDDWRVAPNSNVHQVRGRAGPHRIPDCHVETLPTPSVPQFYERGTRSHSGVSSAIARGGGTWVAALDG